MITYLFFSWNYINFNFKHLSLFRNYFEACDIPHASFPFLQIMACGLSHALYTLGVCGGVRVRSHTSYAEPCWYKTVKLQYKDFILAWRQKDSRVLAQFELILVAAFWWRHFSDKFVLFIQRACFIWKFQYNIGVKTAMCSHAQISQKIPFFIFLGFHANVTRLRKSAVLPRSHSWFFFFLFHIAGGWTISIVSSWTCLRICRCRFLACRKANRTWWWLCIRCWGKCNLCLSQREAPNILFSKSFKLKLLENKCFE